MAAEKKPAAKPAGKPAKKGGNKVYENYKIEGETLLRLKKTCPKCGPGIFMAEAKDRSFCGKCSYTEFGKK